MNKLKLGLGAIVLGLASIGGCGEGTTKPIVKEPSQTQNYENPMDLIRQKYENKRFVSDNTSILGNGWKWWCIYNPKLNKFVYTMGIADVKAFGYINDLDGDFKPDEFVQIESNGYLSIKPKDNEEFFEKIINHFWKELSKESKVPEAFDDWKKEIKEKYPKKESKQNTEPKSKYTEIKGIPLGVDSFVAEYPNALNGKPWGSWLYVTIKKDNDLILARKYSPPDVNSGAHAIIESEINDGDNEEITLEGEFSDDGDIFECSKIKVNGYKILNYIEKCKGEDKNE